MDFKKIFRVYWVLLLSASFIFFPGCQAVEIAGKWCDKDIVIDGNDNEWRSCTQYYDDSTQSSLGVYNDDANVYLCLTTMDTDIQRDVVSRGFIVWLNGEGSKGKELGIRFPVIEQAGPGGPGSPGEPGQEGPPPGEQGAPGGEGAPGDRPRGGASLKELKILTSDDDEGTTLEIDKAAQLGVSAWMANQDNKLVYELKIPLQKTEATPFAVIPSATNIIGAGFMIYGADTTSTSGISGFGGSTSGMSGGGMGGGGMPGGGGGMPGGGFDMGGTDGFSIKKQSTMNDIFNLFNMTGEEISTNTYEDASIINAQGGMGGGDMGGGMGGGDMGGGMPSGQPQSFKVWTKIQLATSPGFTE